MSNPDWDKAPIWANWVAQDESGEWYWYKDKPKWHDFFWSGLGTIHMLAHQSQPTNKEYSKRSLRLKPGMLKKMAQRHVNRS